jgi:hypothetical protein
MAEEELEFAPAVLQQVIAGANPHSAPGPDGLRYKHLQDAGSVVLAPLAALWQLLYDGTGLLPQGFWRLHSAAQLFALGVETVRPIAVGGTLRRLFVAGFVRVHRKHLIAEFQSAGQFGVGVAGGAEVVAALAKLLHESDSWLLDVDGSNAFNSIRRSVFLPAASAALGRGYSYVAAVYGNAPPPLLFRMESGEVRCIPSASGCQQGDPLGPVLFCLGILQLMRDLRGRFEASGISLFGYMDDLTLGGMPGQPVLSGALAEAFEALRLRLGEVGITVNTSKSRALPPRSVGTAVPPDGAARLAALGVPAAADGGISVVGVGVGTDAFVRAHIADTLLSPALERIVAALPDLEPQ